MVTLFPKFALETCLTPDGHRNGLIAPQELVYGAIAVDWPSTPCPRTVS